MKKYILFLFLLAIAAGARAQKVYFVYVQTESATPFFLKMGDRVVSSTSQGYVILSNLTDSTYVFNVGFPEANEKRFRVTVNHGDRGFLLKEIAGNLSLFDLQTFEVIPAEAEEKQPEPIAYRTDEFSKRLALAIDDPSLLFIYARAEPEVIAKKQDPQPVSNDNAALVQASNTEQKLEVQQTAVTPDTVAVETAAEKTMVTDTVAAEKLVPTEKLATENTVTLPVVADTVSVVSDTVVLQPVEQVVFQRSKVTRRSESSTTEGFGLVFLDEENGKVDTIRILIPNPPVVYKTEADLRSESELASGTKEPQKLEHEMMVVKDTAAVVNPACIELGTEADFKKLRRDMVSKDNEEDMVDRARKVFRTTCFTTAQIKSLSALFLTPGGRYNFFDAAYGHVSDPAQFSTLQSELGGDEYYLRRFKALIGE